MDPSPRDVARIAGPLLISYLVDWGLFGVLSMQVYIYYLAFPKDPLIKRGLVYGVYLFMVVQSILFSKSAFETFGPGFGNLQSVDDIYHIWFSVPIMSSVVALVVQGYYAFTIHTMSKDKRILSVIAFISVTQFAGGVFTGVVGHGAHAVSKFFDKEATFATAVWTGAGASCNIIIAPCMSYYYLSPKSQWKLKPTRVPIPVRVIIQSGAMLAAITLLNAVLIQLKGPPYYQTTSGILGNTYANTFLALLNSRARLARPNGYVDNQIPGTHLSQRMEGPLRSQLMFAKPASEGEAITQTEAEMEAQNGHDERKVPPLSISGKSEDSRTDMDVWDQSTKSLPKDNAALNEAQV